MAEAHSFVQNANNYKMIIFLYGQDSYRSKRKLDEIIDQYKKTRKNLLSLVYFDASQKDFSDFYNNFKISSMFAETKLVVLKNVFSSKKFQEDLLSNIKSLESFKDIIVIHEDDSVDERTKTFKTLKKDCKSQEFKLLDSKNLKIWLQKSFEEKAQKINNDALDLLLNYVGNDLWRLSQEVKKLSDFRSGSTIKKEDIELMIKPKIEIDIFKTIDALAGRNKKQALELLKKHLNSGDNSFYLLSMVIYQFRNLLLVKEMAGRGLMYASIIKKSGLHPFVVKKNYFACSQFSFEELKNIYKKIFQFDLDIKIGKVEAETALDLFVSQI